MGIDLQVTMPHDLDASAVSRLTELAAASRAVVDAATALHAALEHRWTALEPIIDFATIRWPEGPLSANEITALWAAERAPRLAWAGFSIYVGRHAIVMTHIEKFGAFLDEELGLQLPLCRAARAFASLVGAREALYSADSSYPTEFAFEWALRGDRFGMIVEALTSVAGPAADCIANCDRDRGGNGRVLSGWYVDRFGPAD